MGFDLKESKKLKKIMGLNQEAMLRKQGLTLLYQAILNKKTLSLTYQSFKASQA